jgi:hypothetical protein
VFSSAESSLKKCSVQHEDRQQIWIAGRIGVQIHDPSYRSPVAICGHGWSATRHIVEHATCSEHRVQVIGQKELWPLP